MSTRANKPICYVCKRMIQKKPIYIGNEIYRHKRCEAGSQKWMKIQRRKTKNRSELYDYFVGEKDAKV